MIHLRDFSRFTGGPVEALIAASGKAFFLIITEMKRPTGPMKTASFPGLQVTTLEVNTFLVPIVRREGSQMAFVSIGRLDGNDVVFPDITVSKFHAYIREVDGNYLLQDGGSHNGTFVNDAPVLAQKQGPATPLRSGDSVRFGTVQCRFIDAAGVIQLLGRRR